MGDGEMAKIQAQQTSKTIANYRSHYRLFKIVAYTHSPFPTDLRLNCLIVLDF
ncbi:hypothetical protein [Planktothrix sp. FACHB-1355]|uniref:hypothetical protein n=1 Tax=Planktothrix sp. FACHB-1355 TaxID=2692854 RepID=UPI001A7EB902|nr:hypothetical protein [Planktothrix sp. FACHB-1355]